MTKYEAIQQLETVIGKLIHLNCQFEGNKLEAAIRNTVNIKEKLQGNQVKIKT